MRRNNLRSILFLVLILLTDRKVSAHEVRPAYLEIDEQPDNIYVLWKQPTMGAVGIRINPVISSLPLVDSLAKISFAESYLIKEWNLTLSGDALDKLNVTIEGLQITITDVLVRITYRDGNVVTRLIHPDNPQISVERPTKTVIPVWEYLQLGILHIWTGIDHLLFVLGLILLVKSRGKLIWTITAFTIAHSITLALATLGFIHIPSAPVEACIALSIMFVGVELIYSMKGQAGLASKFPWSVAFIFGLLHGLGFAGALAQVGLPDKAIPLALFLFNVGVEIGQLAFVIVVLSLLWLLRNFLKQTPLWMKRIPPYTIGCLAAFWFVERMIRAFS